MIDTDKYEGHTEGPWNLTPEGHIVADDMTVVCNKHTKRIVETNHKDTQLIADAPLLLAEVKRLRNWLNNEREVVQAFYDYQEAQTLSGFYAIRQWMIDNGHRVLLLENEDDPTSTFCEWLYDVCDYPWKMDESGYYLGEDGVWREVESEEE
jgi:hypothetical protein